MDHVEALAQRLGKAIADTDRFKRLRDAEKALRESDDARKTLNDLENLHAQVAQKERAGKPIEPEEKRRLAALQAAVHGNEVLQNMARAQADYMEMMNRVNETIRSQLGMDKED